VDSVGDCYDKAPDASFIASPERELINRMTVRSQAEARIAVFDCVAGFSNPRQRHSDLGHVAPIGFERAARLPAARLPAAA